MTRFQISFSDNFFLLHVGRPLWQEDESVICSAIRHRLEYRKTHNNILLSHLRLPNLEGQVPVFISPRNMVAQLYLQALGNALQHGSLLFTSLEADSVRIHGKVCLLATAHIYYILLLKLKLEAVLTVNFGEKLIPTCQIIWCHNLEQSTVI
jgi:hypothetical protein